MDAQMWAARVDMDAAVLGEYTQRQRRVLALEHYSELATLWDYEGWLRRHQAEKEAESADPER